MNAKEAKEIVERVGHQITLRNRIKIDEENTYFRGLGYLDAIEGEEVRILVEALEKVIEDTYCLDPEFKTYADVLGNVDEETIECGECSWCKAKEILAKFKSVTGEKNV